jgi:pyridoxamine 5'-phosphate oxidase family protein
VSAFTSAEIEYLTSQRLGRLATVNRAGEPHVVPVAFRYNPDEDSIDIGGFRVGQTRKYRDVERSGRAAFVVDDVLPPWRPRMIEIRGRGEVVDEGGQAINERFAPEIIRIRPSRIVAFGIDGEGTDLRARDVD